jgi:hypothetical protein
MGSKIISSTLMCLHWGDQNGEKRAFCVASVHERL